jgi:hypothetical protein
VVVFRSHIGETEQSHNLPTCWEETATWIFEEIYRNQVKDEDTLQVFAIMTGLEIDAIADSNDKDLEAGLYQATAFIFQQPEIFRGMEIPERINFRGQWLEIPTMKVQKHTIAQGLLMRRELKKAVNLESIITVALACYLQPIIDGGPFDPDKVPALREELRQLPICSTFPLGFFLLARHAKRGSTTTHAWRPSLAMKIKSALRSLKLLASPSWNRWPAFRSSTRMRRHTGSPRGLHSSNPWTKSFPSSSYGPSATTTNSGTKKRKSD